MTTIITRLYAAEDHANRAVSGIRDKFATHEIHVITPTSGKAADIEALAVKGGVRKSDAAAYAERIRKGQSLVTVHAPWGFANDVIKHLDSHKPVDAGIEYTDSHYTSGWNEAAPFSNLLGLSVLEPFRSSVTLVNDPAPFSGFLRLHTLIKSKSHTHLFKSPDPFSAFLHISTLSDAKPFSSLVRNDKSHVRLVKSAAPFSEAFHLPVLVKDRSSR